MKLRYKIALLPFALPLLLLGASTYAFAGDDLSVSVSTDYVSKYVFRGVALAGGAFQPGAEVSVGNFTAGVWASVASGEESIVFADEIGFLRRIFIPAQRYHLGRCRRNALSLPASGRCI